MREPNAAPTVCTATLNVDSASTQPAPATLSAIIVSGSAVLIAAPAAATPKPMLAERTMTSVDHSLRNCDVRTPPATAPTPNAPSSAPYVNGPPAIRSFAISGINDMTELAPMPNTAPRSSTVAMAGDIAT